MDGIPHLSIGYRLSCEYQMHVYEGWSPSYELWGPQYEELTISMAKCEWLALVTLARIEKWPSQLWGINKGCDRGEGSRWIVDSLRLF